MTCTILGEAYLITDPDFQFITDETVESLQKVFTPADQLGIAIAIHDGDGSPFYLEYPFMSIKSLISKGGEIKIYYFRMKPKKQNEDGTFDFFSEVKFGFIYPGCWKEICSTSTGKLVVEKYSTLFNKLMHKQPIKKLSNGSLEINTEGILKATFFKSGREFDVKLNLQD